MITDKDREISKEIINGMDELYLNNMSCNAPMFIEFTANIISRIRAESAEQARKEAAERFCASCPGKEDGMCGTSCKNL